MTEIGFAKLLMSAEMEFLLYPLSPNGGEGWGEGAVISFPLPLIT
jgi:hypothetical protein